MKKLFQIGLMLLFVIALKFVASPAVPVDRDVGGMFYDVLQMPTVAIVNPAFTAEPVVIVGRAVTVEDYNVVIPGESMLIPAPTLMTVVQTVELCSMNIDKFNEPQATCQTKKVTRGQRLDIGEWGSYDKGHQPLVT